MIVKGGGVKERAKNENNETEQIYSATNLNADKRPLVKLDKGNPERH
jgi:hypothetical protein